MGRSPSPTIASGRELHPGVKPSSSGRMFLLASVLPLQEYHHLDTLDIQWNTIDLPPSHVEGLMLTGFYCLNCPVDQSIHQLLLHLQLICYA